MNWLHRIFRRRLYADLSEELREHIEERTEQLMRTESLSRLEAEQAARRAFGNVTLIEQRSRETWQWAGLETIAADIRFALRQTRKSPGFSLAVVLLLGLGIGATTAVFSLVDTVLLKPVPYPRPESIVIPWQIPPVGVHISGFDKFPWDPRQFQEMRKETGTFRFLSAFQGADFNLTGVGEPNLLQGAQVSWGFFPALGVSPQLGRTFTREEDSPGHEREVVLSDAVWRSRFHADPAILDRIIHLNNLPYTVIGVMPRGFSFPRSSEMPSNFTFAAATELWVPSAMPAVTPRYTPSELAVVGRLQPGVSVAQAQDAMDLFAARMDREHPTWKGWTRSVVTPLQRQVAGDTRRPLLLILAAVGVVLLIACFNVAGLLLTRSIARQREFTLRTALGAGPMRVVRQLLTESLLLAAAGGVLGIAIASAGVAFVKAFGPADLPRLHEAAPDFRVFAFVAVITLFSGILFGLAPGLGATRVNCAESLREGGQKSGSAASHPRLRAALVVSQIALALALVMASALLVRSFRQLLATDSGLGPDRVLTFQLSLPSTEYPDRAAIARFYQQALPRLRALPGVEFAGVTEAVPLGGATESTVVHIVGQAADRNGRYPMVDYTIASPGLFSALGTPLLRGRAFTDADLLSAPPVTIVNRTMARRFWPGQDAIGKQVLIPSQQIPATIVGVVADIHHTSLREVPGPEMFEPYTQNVWPSMALMQVVLRTQAGPESVIGAARQAIHDLDPGIPLANVATIATLKRDSLAADRFSMLLVAFFGALALVLAAVGIYGVIAYSASQRTHEIAIRIALGAQRRSVFGMVLGHGLRLAGLGILFGVFAALSVGRMLAGLLYGVRAADPVIFAAAALLITGVALAASFFPARRAAATAPIHALRGD
ncbi:MAG TPA: ABC transporter permease [Acidobacteriaceae bacterium]|jgi:putative ABC transport system permease protein|nr:ABC transporter permease [Acidobacteriaceae bacterium]